MSTETRVQPTTTSGDHDRFAHYVWTPVEPASAVLTAAIVEGTPVVALCGKRWVPSRDASKFPICPDCARLKAKIQEAAA